ncbi:MAG: hypothetical protein JSW07_13305 [bacterium]|nr:MAG: hypothetical protein JSW07_13305 [bacterium]
MLKKKIKNLMKRCNTFRIVQIIFAAGIIVLAIVIVLELAIPVQLDNALINNSNINAIANHNFTKILQPEYRDFKEFVKIMRSGLFKSEAILSDKPMADKTIERIRSQLKLQCIMELNGEPVAYVSIKGVGLKKCKVGDSISDFFTVLNINEKSIEITIVGHRAILSL